GFVKTIFNLAVWLTVLVEHNFASLRVDSITLAQHHRNIFRGVCRVLLEVLSCFKFPDSLVRFSNCEPSLCVRLVEFNRFPTCLVARVVSQNMILRSLRVQMSEGRFL